MWNKELFYCYFNVKMLSVMNNNFTIKVELQAINKSIK